MYQTILVPVDLGDKHSWRKALPTAVRLAGTFEARLFLLTVLPEYGLPMVGQYFPEDHEAKAREHVTKALRDLAKEQVPDDVTCQALIASGKIYQEILKTAVKVKADLIVMGSHNPELEDFLLGPNAAKVVRHAECSVMVVRE